MAQPGLVDVVRRQFLPTLRMLRAAIEQCPEELWAAGEPPVWQQAYHAMFGVGFWLTDPPVPIEEFEKPAFHTRADPDLAAGGPPVPKAELLAYLESIEARSAALMRGLTSEALLREATMFGRRFTLLDRIMSQVRHVQHHVGDISAVLKAHGAGAVPWFGFSEE